MLQKNKHSIPNRLKHHHRLAPRASLSWSIAKSHVNSIVQSALTFTKKKDSYSQYRFASYTHQRVSKTIRVTVNCCQWAKKQKKNMKKKKEVQIAIFSWCESETLKILMTKMSLFLNLLFFISIAMVDCCRVYKKSKKDKSSLKFFELLFFLLLALFFLHYRVELNLTNFQSNPTRFRHKPLNALLALMICVRCLFSKAAEFENWFHDKCDKCSFRTFSKSA